MSPSMHGLYSPEHSVAPAFPAARATRRAAGTSAHTTRGRIVPGRYHARPVRIEAGHPLVLGSASPRRREMVSWLGVPTVVRTADIDESTRPGEEPHAYLARVTLAKLDA